MILSGAGLSAESGIATYRDPENGWVRTDGFRAADLKFNPQTVFDSFNDRIRQYGKAQPNAAHRAIADFKARFSDAADIVHITQNVDTLSEMAGEAGVFHMHGSFLTSRCSECGAVFPRLGFYQHGKTCPVCRKAEWSVRPDVVLFGEIPKGMDWIPALLEKTDIFIAVGTSGLVYPAADFVRTVRNKDCQRRILITKAIAQSGLDEEPLLELFNHCRLGNAGALLPKTLAEIGQWLETLKPTAAHSTC